LAFVKRIAEQHRGGVDAFSETSQGVRFISNLSVAPLVLSEVHP
jgi:signal transduction histidine kinase